MRLPISKTNSWQIFNRIAHRYDFLNHLLSLGQDIHWRNKVGRVIKYLNIDRNRYLDVATGTCDQLLAVCREISFLKIAGMDRSEKMLLSGREKLKKALCRQPVLLIRGDGMRMSFKDSYFDLVTISFGIRNLPDLKQGLWEIYRVLAPGGYLLVLEFSIPENFIFRYAYLFYFRTMLPKLGAWISGDKQAYYYLNKSVESFPYGEDFTACCLAVGFKTCSRQRLSLGITTLYIVKK